MADIPCPVLSVIPKAAVLAWHLEDASALPLEGGMGTTYRVEGLVLKPTDNPGEAEWCGALLNTLPEDGYRLPRPVVSSTTGTYVVAGWTASLWVEGVAGPEDHWPELFAVAERLHRVLSEVPMPAFLSQRTHRWARADRMAWEEASLVWDPAVLPYFKQLHALYKPVAQRPQIVHGDLSGNLLFAPAQPPAIIDFSPYWRDPLYALAIAVADGLLWHGADTGLIYQASRDGRFPDMLVRALLFRLGAFNERRRDLKDVSVTELDSMQRGIDLIRPLL